MTIEIRSNVLNEEKTEEIIEGILDKLTDVLSKSLGPYGSTTILQDPMTIEHRITKDGYSILDKIKFSDRVASTILEITKKTSRNLVKEVGDGSTSAIMISGSLYRNLKKIMKANKIPSKDIIDILNRIERILMEEIKELSTPITKDNFEKIKSIASISTNNDKSAGELIYNIYKEIGGDGFISLENSPSEYDDYTISDGIELARGYMSALYANEKDNITCRYNSPLIFLSNNKLEEEEINSVLYNVLQHAVSLQRPLVVISKGYDEPAFNFFRLNRMKSKTEVVTIDYAITNKNAEGAFEDLAIYLGATIYNKEDPRTVGLKPEEYLGSCGKFICNETDTKLIEGKGNKEDLKDRIELIKNEIKELDKKERFINTDSDKFKLLKRIADLEGQNATLYIGGKSDMERETRKYLFEDAVYACKSSLKFGYVAGGNLTIPRILRDEDKFFEIANQLINDKELLRVHTNKSDRESFFYQFLQILSNSFIYSYEKVLDNRYVDDIENRDKIIDTCIKEDKIYNLKTDKYEDIYETDVINSSKTDIEIMKTTFSIIGLLATSNQFIAVQEF
ncbi:molecular chaperone GroEL [Bacillus phage vB_BpuM-BpSp]|nr:molecular chaperone GroEL [Bacillus phage vB_BpuM-BpSp]